MYKVDKGKQAYLVGVALGDGNLSNPNGRAVRLRITCDIKYKNLYNHIARTIHDVLPDNKVSIIYRDKNCIDISCYSNKLEHLLGWRAGAGSKWKQSVSVPKWIMRNPHYVKKCLRGLFETDGSVYNDRGYTMVNFVTTIPTLSEDTMKMIISLGFKPNLQKFMPRNGREKHTIRISKLATEFINLIAMNKT